MISSSSTKAPRPVGSSRASDGRQARDLLFLHWTANRAYDHKYLVRTPDFKDRLGAASAAKKAQIERARAIAEDPARVRRMEARSEIIAARDIRIAERERARRELIAREAAERAAAEAGEAAAQAARKAEEEAREARRVEQVTRCRRGRRTGGGSPCDPQSGPEEEEAQGTQAIRQAFSERPMLTAPQIDHDPDQELKSDDS